jgi:hypothetical protein
VWNLDPEVAARDHDRIRHLDDIIDALKCGGLLDFSHESRAFANQSSRFDQVRRSLHK